jgi:tetratricopeptide (TPR) repeat protein
MFEQTEALMQNVKNHYEARRIPEAKIALQKILKIDPSNSEAYFYLGNIFHSQGEIGKAIHAFQKVMMLDPDNTDAGISLSVIYNDIGKYEEAKKIFERVNEKVKSKSNKDGFQHKKINKKFALKHNELGELYLSYQRFDEALFEFKKAASLDPEFTSYRIRLAKTFAKKGYSSKALEELTKLKNEFPKDLEVRLALGLLYYAQGKLLEAQTEWEIVISINPYHEEAKSYLNQCRGVQETTLPQELRDQVEKSLVPNQSRNLKSQIGNSLKY